MKNLLSVGIGVTMDKATLVLAAVTGEEKFLYEGWSNLVWVAVTGEDIALFGERGNLKRRQTFFCAAVTVQEIANYGGQGNLGQETLVLAAVTGDDMALYEGWANH